MTAISGHTRVAAVIGDPVVHSRSPAIHNAAFRSLGLDWVFVAFATPTGAADEAVRSMRGLALGGLSVTMPHKDEVARHVDRLSPEAQRLGAVNCVAWDDGDLVGHNTDGRGFVDALGEQGVELAGERLVLLGAGGAARAVLVGALLAGADEVVVINRDQARARAAVALGGQSCRVGEPADISGAQVVVNATPVGMAPDRGVPLDTGLLRAGQVVVDLVYDPLETPLLAAAAAAGAVPVGGLGMLVHQAAAAFELWTGASAPLEAMWSAARTA